MAFLAGPRPYFTCVAFLAGIFAVYLPVGVALAWGVDAIVDRLEPAFQQWLRNPGSIDLLIQLVVGAVMVVFGWKLAGARERERQEPVALLTKEGGLEELRWELVRGLRSGAMALDHPDLADHLRQTVVAQVAIDQPRYSGLRTALRQLR